MTMLSNRILWIVVFSVSAAYGFNVSLVNPGFEDPVLADGTYQDTTLPGWTKDKPASVYRIYNPTPMYTLQAVDGQNYLWLAPAGSSASLSQVTTDVIQANTVYELQVDIGCLAGNFGQDITVNAYYTVVLQATDGVATSTIYTSGAVAVSSPDWSTLTIRFSSAQSPSYVGRNFKIILGGKLVMFDNLQFIGGALKTLTLQTNMPSVGINTVEPLVGAYPCYEGEVVELEAMSYVDCPEVYTFTGWTGNVADAAARVTTIAMATDQTVTANYVLDSRTCYEQQSGIVLKNPGFERPVLAEDSYQIMTSIPGWTIDVTDKTYTVYNAKAGATFGATEGQNHLGMHLSGAGSAQISQTPLGTIQANTVYQFSFDVAGYPTGGYYVLSVYASPRSPSHLLATTTATMTSDYTWTTVTLTWDSATAPEWVGSTFDVVVGGKKIFLDNFRVTPLGAWTAGMTLTVQTNPAFLQNFIHPAAGAWSFDYDSAVSISAATEAMACPSQYVFDGWVEGSHSLGDAAALTVIADADKTLTAQYVINPAYVPVCGDACRPFVVSDVNRDCIVNLDDFVEFSRYWLDAVE